MNMQWLRGNQKVAFQGNGVAHPHIFHYSESFRQEWRGGKQVEADNALPDTAEPHGHPHTASTAPSQPPQRHQAVFNSTVYWKLIWVLKKKLHKNIEATSWPLISSPNNESIWVLYKTCNSLQLTPVFIFLGSLFSSPAFLAWPEQFSLKSVSYEVKLFNL